MIKKLLFAVLFFTGIRAVAQLPTQKIVVFKGQKIMVEDSIIISVSQEAMGQTIEFNGSTFTGSLLEVKQTDSNKNTITATLKKIKTTLDAGGQTNSYNSENPEDQNSDMAKAFGAKLNMPEDIVLNDSGRSTQPKIIEKKKDDDPTGNPLDAIMNMAGTSSGNVAENAFMLLPANSKPGSSWMDTTNADGVKTSRTYILKSINDSSSIITVLGVLSGTKKMEMQGMEFNAIIGGKVDGEIVVDTRTGLIHTSKSVTEMENSIEIMGMTVPVTGKVTYSISFKPVQ